MFEPMKKIMSQPLGKTSENARRIAAAVVIERAARGLTEVFGTEAAGRMRPKVFRNGRLTVEVDHGVWGEELRLRREEARQSINRQLEQPVVKEISIR
jgi:hypothetical protein